MISDAVVNGFLFDVPVVHGKDILCCPHSLWYSLIHLLVREITLEFLCDFYICTKGHFTSFPVLYLNIYAIYFPCVIVTLDRTSRPMLNNSGQDSQSYLTPDMEGNRYSFNIKCNVHSRSFIDIFICLKKSSCLYFLSTLLDRKSVV